MDECLVRQYPELEKSHFWWVSRRELIAGLISTTSEADALDVLDVGCGSGLLARELAASGAVVTGIDVVSHHEWELVDNLSGLELIEGDYSGHAGDLGAFDCVLALDVVEHIEDDVAFVESLRSNTRPGGNLIVTVPAYEWLWSQHDVVNQHFRRYTRPGLVDVLRRGGLEVSRCGYVFFGLVGPKLLAKGLETWRSDRGVSQPPALINEVALRYFRWEHGIAARRADFLPAGTSVVAVCRRAQ